MFDFKKLMKKKTVEKKIDPLEIYNSLDRISETGPLRPSQELILREWFNNCIKNKNTVIKLHTGEGKTLIGLLILQSKLNEMNEPCLYLCPNEYLVKQVKFEAKKFGIYFCEISNSGEIPEDFQSGKSILITNINKLFNGKTKFGIGNTSMDVGTVILDDSHACIDSIKSSLTIKIEKKESVYNDLLSLFHDDLNHQGAGSLLEIESGVPNTILPISYWGWYNKKDEVLNLLNKNKTNKNITFIWDIIKDSIEQWQGFVSGSSFEISPQLIPIEKFGSFHLAKHRILMSATTHDDTFAIKGLRFDIDAVRKPLINSSLHWSGEKMLIMPSVIDERLSDEQIISELTTQYKNKNYGLVFLAPSFKIAEYITGFGAKVSKSNTIYDDIQALKNRDFSNQLVIVNRYDGIDLPDDTCRILVLNSRPYFDSLADKYDVSCRQYSDIFNMKIAQKIEQGLGRSVRGEKDYSVIVIIGQDLVNFIDKKKTRKYFSSQTQKQIEIGEIIANESKSSISPEDHPFQLIHDLISKVIQRDESWKGFYEEKMNEILPNSNEDKIYNIFELETHAELEFNNGNYQKAIEIVQRLIDTYLNEDNMEKGWYLQTIARYTYKFDKHQANILQQSAHRYNNYVLLPKDPASYEKIAFVINDNRVKRLQKWISRFANFDELKISVDEILDDLSFGIQADKFEAAIKNIGEAIGFISTRPDNEIKKGPDNLWCIEHDRYVMIECKSEVLADRKEIIKSEAGQMNSHCGWFDDNYGVVNCKRILVIPTKKLSYHADFTHDVEIMRRGKLKNLKDNVRNFFIALNKYELRDLSDEIINEKLTTNRLNVKSFYDDTYTEKHHRD